MFNKSEIMKKAWSRTEAMGDALARAYGGIHKLFAIELRKAWAEARTVVARPARAANAIAFEIDMLRNKDRWTAADRAQMDALYAELREAA